jgi:hypothetical protein
VQKDPQDRPGPLRFLDRLLLRHRHTDVGKPGAVHDAGHRSRCKGAGVVGGLESRWTNGKGERTPSNRSRDRRSSRRDPGDHAPGTTYTAARLGER